MEKKQNACRIRVQGETASKGIRFTNCNANFFGKGLIHIMAIGSPRLIRISFDEVLCSNSFMFCTGGSVACTMTPLSINGSHGCVEQRYA